MQINPQKNTMQIKDRLPGNFPFAVRRARKAKLYDYDNQKFFDFYLQNGAVVLGYNAPQITTIIKNSLTRGYLGYYPSHFQLRAKEHVRELLTPGFYIYFFHATDDWKKRLAPFIPESLWHDYTPDQKAAEEKILCLNAYTLRINTLPPAAGYLFSPALGNGSPVITLALKEPLSNLLEDELPLTHYQAVIHTLSEYRKGVWDKTFQKLLAPFSRWITYDGGGIFCLKDFPLSTELISQLYSFGIYLHPKQQKLFLCQNTEPHQLAYLIKVITKKLQENN